jgi:hypothetical protein
MIVNSKMTGFKKVMMVTLAAFVGWMASCVPGEVAGSVNSGSGSKAESELKSVTLEIVGKMPAAHPAGIFAATDETPGFNGGWILFASARNIVTKVVEITATNTKIRDASRVDISLLTRIGGIEIRDIPEHSQYVYIIANLPAGRGFLMPQAGMSLTVPELTLNNRDALALFGEKAITVENSKHVARFELTPVRPDSILINDRCGNLAPDKKRSGDCSRKPLRNIPRCI